PRRAPHPRRHPRGPPRRRDLQRLPAQRPLPAQRQRRRHPLLTIPPPPLRLGEGWLLPDAPRPSIFAIRSPSIFPSALSPATGWERRHALRERPRRPCERFRRVGESVHSVFESLGRLFESLRRLFESLGRLFESLRRLFESLGRVFESLGRLFESLRRRFESLGRLFESL